MTNRTGYRASTFLSLGIAAACLGYADSFLFPEVGVFAAAAIVMLILIYRLQTRNVGLSVKAANWVGGIIAVLYTAWVTVRVLREFRLNEYADMGWHLMTLPLFGPILLFAVPAKLLRDEKTVRDWWMIHWIALAEVAVAGTIAEEPVVFVLIGLYAVTGVWSLTDFFRDRSSGALAREPSAEGPIQIVSRDSVVAEGKGIYVRRVLWAFLAGALAVPLFLLTPRSTAEPLDFGKPRVEIGYAGNQSLDLRRTADLEDNPDPVFEVRAEFPDGRVKDDLNPIQKWRGTTLSKYHQGVWVQERFLLPTAATAPQTPKDPWVAPDLGPETYRLTYSMLAEERSSFLAEPVMWSPNQPVPVASVCQVGLKGWGPAYDGTSNFTRAACVAARISPRRYVQYTTAPVESDLGPPFSLSGSSVKGGGFDLSRDLVANYPLRVREYADKLLADLIQQGKLPPSARPRTGNEFDGPRTPFEYHEAIAREFATHLATDPSFSYTTQLQRLRPESDPVVEFLFDLKTGHCERYAAALVMLLRSEGIPAVLVLGFRGCEPIEEGRWLIRQRDAHAWVEALVSRPARGAKAGEAAADWHWLSLDPTSDRTAEKAASDEQKGFWVRAGEWVRGVFLHYFVNYTPERRARALEAIRDFVTSPYFLTGLGLGVVSLIAILKLRGRRGESGSDPESGPARWFEKLFTVLATHGLHAQPGDTAREFAQGVAAHLARSPGTAPLSSLPVEWAEYYYRARFGGEQIDPVRLAELEERLVELDTAMRA